MTSGTHETRHRSGARAGYPRRLAAVKRHPQRVQPAARRCFVLVVLSGSYARVGIAIRCRVRARATLPTDYFRGK